MKAVEPLSRVRIVLCHPSHPGNIGAAARAMKTMGIARLDLVRPERFPDAEASAMAAGAHDVLEAARVHDSLESALADASFSVALSARPRELSHEALDARTAGAQIAFEAAQGEVALVFGNETIGLSNREVMRCTRLARIPSDPAYESLNLAQAVQVMCYEVRLASDATQGARTGIDYATHRETEGLYEVLERSLRRSGYLRPRDPRRLMDRMRRLFAKARLERTEVNILRGMLAAWDRTSTKK